jgi:hypothetical protein
MYSDSSAGKCPGCGRELPDIAQHCPSCGYGRQPLVDLMQQLLRPVVGGGVLAARGGVGVGDGGRNG